MTDAHTPLRLLVTGAGGQLGRDLVRRTVAAGHSVLGVGRAELDVTDAERCAAVVGAWRPDAVLHCAAWTAVDDAEAHPDRAMLVNERGTRNVAAASAALGAGFVLVSTDYVFAGDAPEGYAENDEPAPINAYGRSKLAAELAAREVHPDPCIARTAWLFGAGGANFVRTIAVLAAERPHLDVVTDQVGSPTWTLHLADALVRCAEARLGGVVHLAGTPTATWFDVAREVVHATGSECEVRPTTTASFPRPAPRPACSILRVTRPDTPPVGDWREGVAAVVGARQPA